MDNADVVVVRKQCGCVSMLCVTEYVDKEFKKDMSEAILEGCTVEHMTAAEARKQEFGCKHKSEQKPLF